MSSANRSLRVPICDFRSPTATLSGLLTRRLAASLTSFRLASLALFRTCGSSSLCRPCSAPSSSALAVPRTSIPVSSSCGIGWFSTPMSQPCSSGKLSRGGSAIVSPFPAGSPDVSAGSIKCGELASTSRASTFPFARLDDDYGYREFSLKSSVGPDRPGTAQSLTEYSRLFI